MTYSSPGLARSVTQGSQRIQTDLSSIPCSALLTFDSGQVCHCFLLPLQNDCGTRRRRRRRRPALPPHPHACTLLQMCASRMCVGAHLVLLFHRVWQLARTGQSTDQQEYASCGPESPVPPPPEVEPQGTGQGWPFPLLLCFTGPTRACHLHALWPCGISIMMSESPSPASKVPQLCSGRVHGVAATGLNFLASAE